MTMNQLYNVYCDESCHLENDGLPVMAWGGVYCTADATKNISQAIRSLKVSHGLGSNFEAKWTKVSPAKADFYLDLVDLFLNEGRLRFRGLVVPDKNIIDHARFDQTHDDWYYKMYFRMLRPILTAQHRYRVYLDIKDSRGGSKTRKLQEILANSIYDFDHKCIERVQQIRSHESEILQIADILIGSLTYANRKLSGNAGKIALIERLRERLGKNVLTSTSSYAADKFNILLWQPQGEAE